VICFRNMYGLAAYYRASVFRWISEVRRSSEELRNERRRSWSDGHESDAAIRSILQEDPNPSLRTIAETLPISPETVRTHMSRINSTLRTFCRILHALTCRLKQVRLTTCLQLFPKLLAHMQDNWRHLITGDENRFCYEYVRDQIWTARDEGTPEVENRTVASRKACWPFHGISTGSML
jgi:hypothetical protein